MSTEAIIRNAFRIACEDSSIDEWGTEREIDVARAIALAAPDMLKALRALVHALGPMKPTKESVDAYQLAEKAIAKAEGRT
jgi:hypothetical protein